MAGGANNANNNEMALNVIDYNVLPTEMISYLLRYLRYGDLMSIGATCNRWRNLVFGTEFKNAGRIHFTKVFLSDNSSPGKSLLLSKNFYYEFYFEDVTFGFVHKLATFIGETAIKFTFNCPNINERQFYSIMCKAKNLKSLTITRCTALFMSGLLMNEDASPDVVESLTNIIHLGLPQNHYLADSTFLRLTNPIRKMVSLDVSYCHIACHHAIYRRFYPNPNSPPSDSILTFNTIGNTILKHGEHIKKLDFSYTMINAANLDLLMSNGKVSLTELKLTACRQLNTWGITSFIRTQPFIKILNLADTLCVNDESIQIIIESLPFIEDLNIAGCTSITNVGCAYLWDIVNLKRLDISRCNNINSDGIELGVARTMNETLISLKISSLVIDERRVKCIAFNCQQLRQLHMDYCVSGVTDSAISCMIRNLPWLTDLSLIDCLSVTDEGITGFIIEAGLKVATPDSPDSDAMHRAQNNDNNNNSALQSSGSVYVTLYRNGPKIKCLKGMLALNLNGCNNVTDLSLIYGIKFIELSSLSLSGCQKISWKGMRALVKHCPSLQQLNISNCINIDDRAIDIVTSKLKRLIALNIDGCTHLTNAALNSIASHCIILKVLSIRGCTGISGNIVQRLRHIKTLTTIHFDAVVENPDMNNAVARRG